jgi:hypothetical protein
MFDNLIPLSVLAGEHHSTVDGLAYHLGNKVIVHKGIRCVEVAVAVAMCDERSAYRAAAAERRHNTAPDPTHARVKALQVRAETLRAAGQLDADMTAVEAMMSHDKQTQLDGTPSRRMDDYLAGRSTGHRFQMRIED